MKRGSATLHEYTVGLIIGLIMLVSVIAIGAKFIDFNKEERETFFEMVETIKTVSEDPAPLAGDYVFLQLPKKVAIIGMNSVGETPQGRFFDGEMDFVISNKFTSGPMSGDAAGKPSHYIVSFPRPPICVPEQACTCWCDNPQTEKIEDEAYFNKKRLSLPSQDTEYDRYSQQFYKNYFVEQTTKDQHYKITCGELTCEQQDGITFQSPMRNEYYNQFMVLGFEQTIVPRIQYTSTANQNIVFDTAEKRYVPNYMYEDGFIITRDNTNKDRATIYLDNMPTYLKTLGYVASDISTFYVSILKTRTGTIAVCINDECSGALEKEQSEDAGIKPKPIYQDHVEISEHANLLFNEVLSKINLLVSDIQPLPIIQSGSERLALDADQFILFTAQGNSLLVELYKEITTKDKKKELVLQRESTFGPIGTPYNTCSSTGTDFSLELRPGQTLYVQQKGLHILCPSTTPPTP